MYSGGGGERHVASLNYYSAIFVSDFTIIFPSFLQVSTFAASAADGCWRGGLLRQVVCTNSRILISVGTLVVFRCFVSHSFLTSLALSHCFPDRCELVCMAYMFPANSVKLQKNFHCCWCLYGDVMVVYLVYRGR